MPLDAVGSENSKSTGFLKAMRAKVDVSGRQWTWVDLGPVAIELEQNQSCYWLSSEFG
jgi:hypothetical protein